MTTGVIETVAVVDDEQGAALVKSWRKKVDSARDFDASARKRYAKDRQSVRSAAKQFKVAVPVAAAYIDVLKSYLYASDPDLDARPAEAVTPPPLAELTEIAREKVQADQKSLEAAQQASTQAIQQIENAMMAAAKAGQPIPQVNIQEAAEQAARAKLEALARRQAEQMAQPFHRRHREAKQFAQTLDIVIKRMWQRANLKLAAENTLVSGLTVGIGWFKCTWQDQTGENPAVAKEMAGLTTKLKSIQQKIEELALGDASEPEAEAAELQLQIDGLKENLNVVTARGLAIDFVDAEDIQVAEGVNLDHYLDAPWIAHRVFFKKDAAKATYPEIADDIGEATTYRCNKPEDDADTWNVRVDAEDAESYTKYDGNADGTEYVCVWEVWDRESGQVLTYIEGIDRYAREPFAPDATRRFYPFFQFSPVKLDKQRHPQSLVTRSRRLLDEYNRARTGFATHRGRAKPGVFFDAANIDADSAGKIARGDTGEYTPDKGQNPQVPVAQSFFLKAYPPVDMGLYSTAPIRAELEMIWGIQEALSSSIHTAKTATEAEIQQHGSMSRLDFMRNALDTALSQLAYYCAEVLLIHMDREDVVQIAGQFALWPQDMGGDDLDALVLVDIKAGSSGKPNTMREHQVWIETLPVIQNAILKIGQLRGSEPDDIANCIEELVIETLARTGQRLDADRFLPAGPQMRAPEVPGPVPTPSPSTPPSGPNPSAAPQPSPNQPTELAA